MIPTNEWKDLQEFLKSIGEKTGASDSDSLYRDCSRFLDLLLEKNKVVNLTALREERAAFWKHIADSLTLLTWEPLGNLVDWGSGGGLPGIPLALARRSVGDRSKVFFLDSVGKKIRAIEEFCQGLGLNESKCLYGRGEDLMDELMKNEIGTVVMRAVAPAERAVHWLNPKIPQWVFLLGPQQLDAWYQEAAAVERKGFEFTEQKAFSLPHEFGQRVLLKLSRK